MLSEVLPKAGLVYSEKGNLGEILCKPKIMPIKSITLEKLEAMEKAAKEQQQQTDQIIQNARGWSFISEHIILIMNSIT